MRKEERHKEKMHKTEQHTEEIRKKEAHNEESLSDKLAALSESDSYPFHMPGHKRNFHGMEDPYLLDITEIEGFDDLHHANGILKTAMERTACLYRAKESCFLVNGSSGGILAAISAVAGPGDRIVMARNCHKSAYHAVFLRNLQVDWIYPDYRPEGFYGQLSPKKVEEALKNPGIRAVVLVSPTYEGIVSDIRKIAGICHAYGCALIVDEAHGAHFTFGYEEGFPLSALDCGADLVIQSTHKTLPAFTQTALLHVGEQAEKYVDLKKLHFYLQVYQSSSPSYLFMASIQRAVEFMASDEGKTAMTEYALRLKSLRKKLAGLKHIRLYEARPDGEESFYDISKLVLVMPENSPYDGGFLADTLRRKYHLEPEMNTERYVILMTSVMDREEGFRRLFEALKEIDGFLQDSCREETAHESGLTENEMDKPLCLPTKAPEQVLSCNEAYDCPVKWVESGKALGRVSHEFVYIYPPGIPILIPGERIGEEVLSVIMNWKAHGLDVRGTDGDRIPVVDRV